VTETLLVCSVELELEPLLSHASRLERLGHPRVEGWRGVVGERPVIAIMGGMGKTNAAASLAAILERHSVAGVAGFGVAGAYPGSGLRVGGVALATAEVYGDEGVAAPQGWMSCEGIGIPLLESGGRRHFNHFPVDARWLETARLALGDAGIAAGEGPFVTVSCCSGTTARGIELAERFGAVCETMEGAAYAHVAATYALPFLEVRGVSNRVEDRDLTGWRLRDAAEAAANALALILVADS